MLLSERSNLRVPITFWSNENTTINVVFDKKNSSR